MPDPQLRRLHPFLLALLLVLALPSEGESQVRFGLSMGGAGTVALIIERRWDHQGLEVQIGTWGFSDVSVAVTGKQYVGSNAVEPF
ncbi:MAG: hypothetical protein OEO23_12875, partial [Gemmatimonadota bacterium]|nr:hypothetical protein [Gemmatimonadota bacterium]